VSRISDALHRYQFTYGPARGVLMMARRATVGRSGTDSTRLVRTAPVGGSAEPLWLRWGSTDDMTFSQVFYQRDYDLEYVRDPASIIDAGANIGFASVYFAQRYPAAKIVAIEPDPDNVRVLRRNCASYPQVTVVEAALWHESGTVSLVDPGVGEWGFRVGEAGSAEAVRAGSVRAVTVPEAMALIDVDHVDLLKIDIEGGEREVFGACDDWIGRVNSVVAELHEETAPGAIAAFKQATADFAVQSRRGENRYAARPADEWVDGPPS
jgi:FkbM family methyltransferase